MFHVVKVDCLIFQIYFTLLDSMDCSSCTSSHLKFLVCIRIDVYYKLHLLIAQEWYVPLSSSLCVELIIFVSASPGICYSSWTLIGESETPRDLHVCPRKLTWDSYVLP